MFGKVIGAVKRAFKKERQIEEIKEVVEQVIEEKEPEPEKRDWVADTKRYLKAEYGVDYRTAIRHLAWYYITTRGVVARSPIRKLQNLSRVVESVKGVTTVEDLKDYVETINSALELKRRLDEIKTSKKSDRGKEALELLKLLTMGLGKK